MPAEVGKDRHQPPSSDPVLMRAEASLMCWVGSGEQVKTDGEPGRGPSFNLED